MHVNNWRQTGITRLLLLGMIMALAGCGFHPRGGSELPFEMAVTYISSAQPYASLVDDFSTALRARGGRVTRDRSEATAFLNILSDTADKRLLSINTDGKVLEYETRQTIRFSVITSDNLVLLEEGEVSMSKGYLYSSSDILGKQREDRVLQQTLQRNLVNLAMLRITATARELRWTATGSPAP